MPFKRYQSYKRKGRAARTIQSAYRRYSQAGSSDQRQLSSVLKSHRKANPYQITPSSGRTVTFWRKTQFNVSINQSTGFNGLGNNLNWGFSLGRIFGFINGSFQYAVTVSSSSEFQALFDYYKIDAVKIQMFYTKNTDPVSTTTGASHGMPIILIANDFDDIGESMTLATMNERVGVRHTQFDATNTNGINHYIKPKPTSVMVQTDVSTGVQSISNSGVVFGSQWLDVAASNIVHNGVKVFYDNQGLSAATNLGNVTFVFDVCYVFKGYR